jgi:uncharacterized protein YcfJ
MKSIAIAVVSALTIAPAFAQWDGPYAQRSYSYDPPDRPVYREEYARVIESTPVYASSREECWNPRTGVFEERRDNHTSIGKGAAAGAVLGGVLGHQVDHGEGTAAGAIIGGLLGHQIEKQRDRDNDQLDLSRCRVASYGSGVEGYDVRYRYRGNEYVARMSQDPGSRLRLGEDIRWDGTPYG